MFLVSLKQFYRRHDKLFFGSQSIAYNSGLSSRIRSAYKNSAYIRNKISALIGSLDARKRGRKFKILFFLN